MNIIIGMSGASGIIYGIRLLEAFNKLGHSTHLVMSRNAEITAAYETDLKIKDIKDKAHFVYRNDDFTAAIASGSFRTDGMIIAPCSVRLLSAIAYGASESLIARAADVVLKERRKLVILLRETPLTLAHINAMQIITTMGGIIAPPVPAFYNRPQTIDDIVDHTVGRTLDLFDIESKLVKRWGMKAT